MNIYDLTGQEVSKTYYRVVQVISGSLYDGLGNYIDINNVISTTLNVGFINTITLIANEPYVLEHNLNLVNKNSYVINCSTIDGNVIDLDVISIDNNSVEIISLFDVDITVYINGVTYSPIKSFFQEYIELTADVGYRITHNLNLINKNSFIYNCTNDNSSVSVNVIAIDNNTIDVLSNIDTTVSLFICTN